MTADASLPRPLISVVMPCFNAAPFVAEAIASVMEQTWGKVELVIVDDGSTDDSADIIREQAERYPGRIRLLHTSRSGPYPARNRALAETRGAFIAFLDADDWWQPDALEKLHTALTQADADLAYCGWQNVGEGIQAAPYVPPDYAAGDAIETFIRTCPWPIHAALVKRTLVDRLGGFSERRYSSMDYDFWLRTLAATRRIVRVPEVLAFYRWHGAGQVSAVKWRQVLDALEAQRHFIGGNPQLVAHLAPQRLYELTEGQVLRQAYRAFWKRDLVSSQKLFRHAAGARACRLKDLRHIACALLPMPLYRWVVRLGDGEPQ